MNLKIVLTGLITLLINVVFITIQYIDQSTHMGDDLFIRLGFPYRFYFFQPDFELHGSNMRHFIYDSVIWFGFSFLVVLIVSYLRKGPKNNNGKEVIDIIE